MHKAFHCVSLIEDYKAEALLSERERRIDAVRTSAQQIRRRQSGGKSSVVVKKKFYAEMYKKQCSRKCFLMKVSLCSDRKFIKSFKRLDLGFLDSEGWLM
jgi:hypothetical protein